jgi:hypothetical protein
MRFLVRWAFRLFLLLLVLGIGLVLLKDVLAKALVEHQIQMASGMEVKIGSLEVALFSPTITLEDLKVFNPAEFGGGPLLNVPDLHLEYDLAALARRQLRFPLVRLWVSEVNVVEARDGRTNLVLALDGVGGVVPRAISDTRIFPGLDFIGIDTLNLSLGTIKYTSLRRPENKTEVQVALRNEVYPNIKSFADFNRVLVRSLFRNGIVITNNGPVERRARPNQGASGGKYSRKPGEVVRKPGD